MGTLRIALLILLSTLALTACSDVGFQSLPKLSCEDIGRDQDTDCTNQPNFVSISFTFGVGDVDILFVVDNSGSMFVEQRKMADAFPNFFNQISNLFYRIAITTTDVSAKGARGQFVEFKTRGPTIGSGLHVIDHTTPNADELFKGTIERQETILCDQSGFNAAHCPSDDERGIYAANLAVKAGDSRFFRPGAHLALVVLSDEDERGQGARLPSDPQFEADDLPETLVLNMKQYYPTKSMSVHSVVTNNETCRALQTQYPVGGIWPTRGVIGTQYMKLSQPSADLRALGNLLNGSVGSICDSNYGAQLSNIGNYVKNDTANAPKQLVCEPDPDSIRIVTRPTGYESQIRVEYDDQNRVYFSNLPLGVKVTYSYECPRF